MAAIQTVGGSYRDPDGFVFWRGQHLLRQVNSSYSPAYQQLMSSGLYQILIDQGLLIKHVQTTHAPANDKGWLVIEPELIPFISYPYEWSFSQLKDAALLTLRIQQEALAFGMTLKDASAYNVQFLRGKPIFIDTLSFDFYQEGAPWGPYKQFCEHFLAPLALMAHTDVRLHRLLLSNLEGVSLDLASRLLPWPTYCRFGLLLHIHLHAKAQQKYVTSTTGTVKGQQRLPKNALLQLLQSLESAVKSLTWKPHKTLWADYYHNTNYLDQAMKHKEQVVKELLQQIAPQKVWDLGANTGRFSQIAAELNAQVIAMDFDIGATEIHYLENKNREQGRILPLVMDATQPSPSLGWRNRERSTLPERGQPEAIMALALIHHLAIGKNIPLAEISAYLEEIGPHLIIEFVPKTDSQVLRLLANRKDIFPDYTQESFEATFSAHFTIKQKIALMGTERTMYWMSRHGI